MNQRRATDEAMKVLYDQLKTEMADGQSRAFSLEDDSDVVTEPDWVIKAEIKREQFSRDLYLLKPQRRQAERTDPTRGGTGRATSANQSPRSCQG
jgi:hypothetical protein